MRNKLIKLAEQSGLFEKLASTPGNVKQYRRALQAFMGQLEHGGDGAFSMFLHDTRARGEAGTEGALHSRIIRKSEEGVGNGKAAQGPGVYVLRGETDGTNLARPVDEGFMFPTANASAMSNAAATNLIGRPMHPKHGLLPKEYALHDKDYAIVNWSKRRADSLRELAAGTASDKESALNRMKLMNNDLRGDVTADGMTPHEWHSEYQRLKRSPEAVTIRRNPRLSGDEHTEQVNALIEKEIGEQPKGGLRTIDSRVLHMAMQDAGELHRTGVKEPTISNTTPQALKALYKQDLKQRRALRRFKEKGLQ